MKQDSQTVETNRKCGGKEMEKQRIYDMEEVKQEDKDAAKKTPFIRQDQPEDRSG